MDVKHSQCRILQKQLRTCASTAHAKALGISAGMTYDDFKSHVPLCTYDDLKPWVDRCKSGEPDVLWPGVVRKYAVSAGTTGIGKHIPIYQERLVSDLAFMRRVMWHILRDAPDPGLFLGKHVALSGSVELIDGLEFGEISGMLACASPKWIRPWHTSCPERAAFMPWTDRYNALLVASAQSDVRVLTGVPSWILIFLRDLSNRTGKQISQLWPNLKLIVTGGVALSGYHGMIQSELSGLEVRYLENYGASEGYFAFDWFASGSMILQHDSDIFYEFIPTEAKSGLRELAVASAEELVPLWAVQPGVPYALVVSTTGLTRYVTNDEVVFTSVVPSRIRITGRLNEMTDTFGEAVTSSDVHDALRYALPMVTYEQVHVRPVWSGNPPLPRHEWIFVAQGADMRNYLLEMSTMLASEIDHHLQSVNRHYAIRRETEALGGPIVSILDLEQYEAILRARPRSQSKLGLFLK